MTRHSLALDTSRLAEEFAAPIGRRSAARLRLSIPARLVTLSDTRRCILIDLSRTGAQVGLEKPLRKGESALIEVTGFELFGDVVRCDAGPKGGVNGLHFDEPLSNEEVLSVRDLYEGLEEQANRALRREVREWVSGLK